MAITALNPVNVLVGTAKGPGIWVAPVGTALPTDTSTALDAAFSTLGYLSEDGVTFSQSTDSEEIKPWQSRSAVRTIITGRSMSLEFTMLEFNAQNLAFYFGQDEPVATNDAWSLEVRSDGTAKTWACVIEVKDGLTTVRYAFPRATLSEAGDLEITNSGVMALPVTLAAQDDNGTLAHVIHDKTAPAGRSTGTSGTSTVKP